MIKFVDFYTENEKMLKNEVTEYEITINEDGLYELIKPENEDSFTTFSAIEENGETIKRFTTIEEICNEEIYKRRA